MLSHVMHPISGSVVIGLGVRQGPAAKQLPIMAWIIRKLRKSDDGIFMSMCANAT